VKLRNLLWQIPALLVISMPLWWSLAVNFLIVQKTLAKHGAPDNSLEMRTVVMQQSNNGRDELLLHADRMYSKDDQRLIYMENVKARLGDTARPVRVTCGESVYNTSQEIMTMMNNVEVINDDFVLKTVVMRYLSKYRKIKSAAAVQAVSRDMKISGTSFMYDLNNGDFRVGSRVHFELL